MTVATYNTYQNGDKTVNVQLVEKSEVTVRCGKNYGTNYRVETTDGDKLYVFGLEKDTWEQVQVNSCHQFTYYLLKPLLADYLEQENQYQNLYETTGYITLIEKVGCQKETVTFKVTVSLLLCSFDQAHHLQHLFIA